MDWSQAARSVWGKLSPDTGSWMPLVDHLEDAGGVAGYLWDEFLPRATRAQLAESVGMTELEVRRLAVWLASVHDVGKATPAFAAKAFGAGVPGVVDVMRDHGLVARPTVEDRYAPHATAGQVLVEQWLQARAPNASRRVVRGFGSIVGCHHGATPTVAQVRMAQLQLPQLGVGEWNGVQKEILDSMADGSGFRESLTAWLGRPLPLPAQVILSGLVIMADWIASDADYFTYTTLGDTRLPRSAAQRLEAAVAELELPPPWQPDTAGCVPDDLLARRFRNLARYGARPLQKRAVELARQMAAPGLFIIEGPMGVGKTEAALLAAEVLAERFGLGGVFVGLPTMATANPMFERVLAWLSAATNGRQASVSLAHGKASLNDSYQNLIRQQWRGALYDEPGDASAVVNSWLRGRKRAGLASFVVGTIDQSLFAALKAKHVVLRHLGLVGKVVIIDEVHAADDYMREYLKSLLAWLGAYGTPVILMSATLPPSQRDELLNAYGSGRGMPELRSAGSDAYPRIALLDRSFSEHFSLSGDDGLCVKVRQLADDTTALVQVLQERLADGGCVGVVCNTVSRAQQAYLALSEAFPGETTLLHSRFISTERSEREARLVQRLGPNAESRPHRLVVVGTQVLEQSLDVDFDLLVSDLAPADLLLQRAGRLHRHRRPSRPARVVSPELWVRGVQDWNQAPPLPVPGSAAVYGRQRLLRSAAVFIGRGQMQFPTDIPSIVRLAYDPSAIAPPGWEVAWSASEDVAFTEHLQAVSRARTYLLDQPVYLAPTLNGLIDVGAGDPDSNEAQGRSAVRDGEEGIEVMVLWRDEQGVLHLPPSHALHQRVISQGLQWGTNEDERLAKAMASCTLRLPAMMCYPRVVDSVVSSLERAVDYSGWQQSRWIAGQLAVVFDPSGHSRVADFRLTYDPETGLTVEKAEES